MGNDPLMELEDQWAKANQTSTCTIYSVPEEPKNAELKLKCLEIANAMWHGPDNNPSADEIVSSATKFWNFLLGSDQSATDA